MDAQVIILAAGQSKRMGEPKAFVKCNGKMFIEYITELYLDFGAEIIIVFNPENFEIYKSLNTPELKTKIVINRHPEYERFYSIKLGAQKAAKANTYTFLQNIDNPFIKRETLTKLWENRSDADVIIPSYENKGGHPILMSPHTINELATFREDNFDFRQFLFKFTKKHIETTDKEILRNINSKKDLPCATFKAKM